jgi:hypothetical protein
LLPLAGPAPLSRRTAALRRGRISRARLSVGGAGRVTFSLDGDTITADGKRPAREASTTRVGALPCDAHDKMTQTGQVADAAKASVAFSACLRDPAEESRDCRRVA